MHSVKCVTVVQNRCQWYELDLLHVVFHVLHVHGNFTVIHLKQFLVKF